MCKAFLDILSVVCCVVCFGGLLMQLPGHSAEGFFFFFFFFKEHITCILCDLHLELSRVSSKAQLKTIVSQNCGRISCQSIWPPKHPAQGPWPQAASWAWLGILNCVGMVDTIFWNHSIWAWSS